VPDVNAQGGKYDTALYTALICRFDEVARLLREYGAIEAVLDQGQSNPHDLETPENWCDWFDLGWEGAGEDQEADVEEGVETE
jgi:hypothetical protein